MPVWQNGLPMVPAFRAILIVAFIILPVATMFRVSQRSRTENPVAILRRESITLPRSIEPLLPMADCSSRFPLLHG